MPLICCLPPEAPDGAPGGREVTRRAALLAIGALGVARAPHIRAHFTRGRYPGLPEALAELHRDRLIGRADLSIDRRAGRLVAHAIHREPDAPRGATVARAIRRALERLAEWRGAGDLELREVPAAWPMR